MVDNFVMPKLWTVSIKRPEAAPIEFVIDLIRHVFDIDEDEAFHHAFILFGRHAVTKIGQYPKEIAETKKLDLVTMATNSGYALEVEVA